MAKVLTQEEIDALLNTVTSGDAIQDIKMPEVEDLLRPVVTYDFKHPNRVSKDQIRTLENLHDNFAGHFASSLAGITRAVAEVELVSVDQITYSEFISSLFAPSCTYTFTASPMDGACVVDFSPSLAFAFVERMFGGTGKVHETERELTGIERAVMARIISKVYNDLESAWEHIVPIKTKQISFETNPQFVQVVPPGETVVVVSLQIKLFKVSGSLSVCYPYVSLEGIMHKLSAQNWIDATKKKDAVIDRSLNLENLLNVETNLTAILGRTSLKLRDFLRAKPGDTIQLNRKISDPMELLVEGLKKFEVHPGLSGKKKACQVVRVFEEPGKEH